MHGFQQREPQRCPPQRVEVHTAAGQFAVEVRCLEVPADCQPGRRDPGAGVQTIAAHAENLQRGGRCEAGQQVRSRHASPADGLVHHHTQLRHLPGIEVAGVRNPMFDDGGGRPAAVPEEFVEVRHMHHRNLLLVRERMPGEGDIALGGVVFHVHGGQVDAGPPPQQPGHLGGFLRPLQDDGVNAGRVERPGGHLADRRRPVPAGAAQPPRAAVGQHRQEVLVTAADERVRP